MSIEKGRVYIRIPYEKKDLAKRVNGHWWHPERGQWSFPEEEAGNLGRYFPSEMGIRSVLAPSTPVKHDLSEVSIPDGYSFKRKPMDHQVEMIKAGLKNQKFAFFCEMGTGKTKAVIDIFAILHQQGKVKRCLVISPLTIVEVWEEEIVKDSYLRSLKVLGTAKKRTKLLTEESEFYIINYDALTSIQTSLRRLSFDMVVLDESSYIKNPKSQRSRICMRIFPKVPYKYVISGTPVSDNPVDIFPQYYFLNPRFLPFGSWYSFRNYFCIMGGYGGYKIVGRNHMDQLQKLIADYSIQKKKEECQDLPPKVYEKQYLRMPKPLRDQYMSMKEELMLELENGIEPLTAEVVVTKQLRLLQICSGAYLPDQKHNEKLKALWEVLLAHPDEQVVVWCKFLETIHLIERFFDEKGVSYSHLYGAVKDRAEQRRKFQDGETKVFIGQFQTGGMGITLTAGNVVVVFENTWRIDTRKQFEDRSHRQGQTKTCVYIDLFYVGTIEEDVMKAIASKQDIATYLVASFAKGNYKIERRLR